MPDRCGLNIANPDEAEKYPVICIGFMHASSRQLSIPPVCKSMHTTSLYTREASLCSTSHVLRRRRYQIRFSTDTRRANLFNTRGPHGRARGDAIPRQKQHKGDAKAPPLCYIELIYYKQ